MTGLFEVLAVRQERRHHPLSPTTMGILKSLTCVLVLCSIVERTNAKSESRVVCYYTNWSAYRQGPAKFLPDNINPYLCTHLIYAFGGLTSDSGIKPFDKYQDIDKGGYTKFNGLKTYNKGLKTLIAIGGWNEGSGRFSRLVADADSRKTFIKHAIRFLRQHHFDGLDLDWEYPAARDGGEPEDKKHYALWIKELREAFEDESRATGRSRLLLTIAVPAGIEWIEKGYDIPTINKNVDFFNLLTYDYHASTEPTVNHHAPLKPKNGFSEYDYKNQLNIEYTISHYLQEGADADKLVVGLPTYGRSYTLFNIESSDIGAPASGPGTKGKYTKEPGYLAYYEICEGVKSGDWTVENSESDAQGPHAVNNDQWIGYDDPRIMAVKAKWVRENKLGGIMFWSVDNDDFRGTCHGKPFPLIEAAKTAYYTGETPPRSSGSKNSGSRTTPSTRLSTRRTTTTPAPPSTTTGTLTSTRRKTKKINNTNGRRRRVKPKTTTTPRPTTTTPVPVTSDPLRTPPPPTTPDPGVDFECKDEGFFPHPRDCKKYFWCLDAPGLGLVAHHFTCPAGLFFNKNADSCDYARNVPCKPGGSVTTTTTTTEEPSTTKRTTTTATPEEVEYEYYDEDEETDVKPKSKEKTQQQTQNTQKSVQEIKDIKNLLSIIRKLGGIEELEKYLADNPGVSSDLVEYEYEDESEEEEPEKSSTAGSQVLAVTPKPPAAASVFPNRNRFTPAAVTSRAKFNSGANRYTNIQRNRTTSIQRSPVSEESSEEVSAVVTSSSTQGQTTKKSLFRPKYITLTRGGGGSKEKSSSGPSSTETSVVVRFSNEEKLLDEAGKEETTEKPDRFVTISRPYAKVAGVLENEREEKVTDNRARYVTLARARPSATSFQRSSSEKKTENSPSSSPTTEEVDEEEYEKTEEESEEDEPPTTPSTTTSTTAKPRIRIPGRPTSSILSRSRVTTTTTVAPTESPRRNRNFAPGSRRNLLLERKRGSTTSTEAPPQVEDEGTDESISSLITASEPVVYNNRLNYIRRRQPRPTVEPTLPSTTIPSSTTIQGQGQGRSRSRYRASVTTLSIDDPYTYTAAVVPVRSTSPTIRTSTLTPLSGSFQSALIRRRTRRPTSTSTTVAIPSTTTTTTTTTTPRPTTSTIRYITSEPVDYIYYYYDEEPTNDNEELFAKSPSQSIQSSQAAASNQANQFLRRSLDLESVANTSSSTKVPSVTLVTTSAPPPLNSIPHRNQALVPLSQKIVMKKDGSIECLDSGVYPHPLSCKMYVNCVQLDNGQGLRGWVYTCSKHLTFDPIGGMCNWAPQKDTSVCHDLSFQ